MKAMKINIPKGYEIDKINSTFENIVFKPINPIVELPTTFQQVYHYMFGAPNLNEYCPINQGYYGIPLECLQALLLCRDCYWKILNWRPNWKDCNTKYVVNFFVGEPSIDVLIGSQGIFAFPTRESAEAFMSNFKHLIDGYKELF